MKQLKQMVFSASYWLEDIYIVKAGMPRARKSTYSN